MSPDVTIRAATAADFLAVAALLREANLPVADVDPQLTHFFVGDHNGTILAAIGLEHYGEAALLRSLVTAEAWRNKGLASQLVERLLLYAREKGVRHIYLITTTAEKFFQQKGFEITGRPVVHTALLQSREFNGLCPSTAAVMYRLNS